MMGKVNVHATISLDGYMAGPKDEIDWIFKYGKLDDEALNETFKNRVAVVVGSRSFNFEKQ
jgi:hypothetical protein